MIISIQQAFENYLERMKLHGLPEESIQYQELRRAFFGGVASFAVGEFLSEEQTEESDRQDQNRIMGELTTFWENQTLTYTEDQRKELITLAEDPKMHVIGKIESPYGK